MKFEPALLLARLPKPADEKWSDGVPFAEVFAKGRFSVEIFAPGKKDYQTPHDQDEFYFVISGSADFVRAGVAESCRAGDAIFVPAGEEHFFDAISADFATWVVFF